MNFDRCESLRRSLRSLDEFYASTRRLLEECHTLLSCEAATAAARPSADGHPVVDDTRLTVSFRGRTCYLGNGLPFRLLARLARRPGYYFTHDELLDEVWDGTRTPDAVRSVVKTLRQKLRQNDLADLADAIDGSARGRYALRLSSCES